MRNPEPCKCLGTAEHLSPFCDGNHRMGEVASHQPAPIPEDEEENQKIIDLISQHTKSHPSADYTDMTWKFAGRCLRSEARIARLEAALRWALGEGGDFPVRSGGDGMFWWRKELRVRAALSTPLGTPGRDKP